MKRKPPAGNTRQVRYIDGNSRFVIINKTGKTVQCESFQERKLALLLERDHTVVDYISQPESLHFVNSAGQSKTYTPDFRVTRVSGPDEIYEVTLTERCQLKPGLREREAAAVQICQSQGLVYRVFTEEVLPNDTETTNLLTFYTARMARCAQPAVRGAAVKMLAGTPLHIEQLIECIMMQTNLPRGTVHIAVKHLIWQGDLDINWKQLFYLTTPWTGKRFAPSALVWQQGVRHE
jgi:hypothetical protein